MLLHWFYCSYTGFVLHCFKMFGFTNNQNFLTHDQKKLRFFRTSDVKVRFLNVYGTVQKDSSQFMQGHSASKISHVHGASVWICITSFDSFYWLMPPSSGFDSHIWPQFFPLLIKFHGSRKTQSNCWRKAHLRISKRTKNIMQGVWCEW